MSELFDRLLALSAFDGDSAAALRALHAHFGAEFPGSSVALLLIDDEVPGNCRLTGLIGPDGTEHRANDDPYGLHARLPRFADSLAQRLLASQTVKRIQLSPTERGTPLARALSAPASVLAAPIVNAGLVSHWLAFGNARADAFDAGSAERALLQINLAANLVIRQLAVRSLARETERQRQAIEGLADVQRRLLPDHPTIRGLDYAIHWQPAETAAGDYYDLMSLSHLLPPELRHDDADAWGVMLADVSGHGAAAAMEAVQFDAILRTYSGDEEPGGPAGALTYANRHYFSRRQRQHFMTVFGMSYRPMTHMLDYVCAGHPPALLRRADGTISLVGAGDDVGIPLGVLRDHRWENVEMPFAPGDTIVIYTDGIVEARDADGQQFGRERLEAVVANAPVAADGILSRVRDAVEAHQGGSVGVDDQTVIVLRAVP